MRDWGELSMETMGNRFFIDEALERWRSDKAAVEGFILPAALLHFLMHDLLLITGFLTGSISFRLFMNTDFDSFYWTCQTPITSGIETRRS